jgi:hypothetical protein
MQKNELRIALLIDGDNAQATLIPSLLKILDKYGKCVIRRVYGDWTANNMSGWQELEQMHAIQLIQQSRYAKGKNATDIALVIAAMEILHSGKVDGFCIVSSDSDFTPLVIRLKDAGATVIAAGKSTSPLSYKNACSYFIPTDDLTATPKPPVVTPKTPVVAPKAPAVAPKKLPSAAPKPPAVAKKPAAVPKAAAPVPKNPLKPISKAANATPKIPTPLVITIPDARPLLLQAYEMSTKKDGWASLGELGHYLWKIDPQFKYQAYGQNQLLKLVSQYQDTFQIKEIKGTGNITNTYHVKLKP